MNSFSHAPSLTETRNRHLPLTSLLLVVPSALTVSTLPFLEGNPVAISAGVAGALAVLSLWAVLRFGIERATSGPWILVVYLTAYLTIQFCAPEQTVALHHALMAAALLVPVALFIYRELTATAGSVRKAKFLLRDLIQRTEWPERYEDYRALPEVRALREHLRDNPAPVLPIISYPDVRIQVAALWALEFQPIWKKDQAESVIHLLNMTDEPAIREAALMALGNVRKDRHLVCLLPFLVDQTESVRRAAYLAILWKADVRWTMIRENIRNCFGNRNAEKDGPLPCSNVFPPAAIDDLVRWSSESGSVGKRSTQTLIRFCKKALTEDNSHEAVDRVMAMVSNPKVPAGIRVEMAHRLKAANEFAPEVAAKLIAPNNPTMLRLLAAGALLSQRGEDARAIEVLKEAAQHPNREISLAAAVMIQKYIGVDMGLPVGGEAPAANTRLAAEVARKVLAWATRDDHPSNGNMPQPASAY